jgi:hypothetical protein
LGLKGEVWQRGFSEVRVTDQESFLAHKEYIDQNPVKAGWRNRPKNTRIARRICARKSRAAAKAELFLDLAARLKLVP